MRGASPKSKCRHVVPVTSDAQLYSPREAQSSFYYHERSARSKAAHVSGVDPPSARRRRLLGHRAHGQGPQRR